MLPVYIIGASRSPIAKVKRGDPNTSSIDSIDPRNLATQVLNDLFDKTSMQMRDSIEFNFRMGSVISKALEPGMFHAPAKNFISKSRWNKHACADALLPGAACATGMLAVQQGVTSILTGYADFAITGGVDMMSRYPDRLVSRIFNDVCYNKTMAALSDIKARQLGLTREHLDDYAALSYQRAKDHINDHDLVPIHLKSQNEPVLTIDEGLLKILSPEAIKRYPPLDNCELTSPATASKYGDAAAFLLLASERAVEEYSLKPIARIIGFARHSEPNPEDFIIAPVWAILKALDEARLTAYDIDMLELNEAFSSTVCATATVLEIPVSKINLWGGAIGTGHPIGATGAALLVKNITMLRKHGKRFGVVALCSAIAEGIACVIERI